MSNKQINNIIVTPCISCKVMLSCLWESPYYGGRDEPSTPGYWYSTTPSTVRDSRDDIMERGEITYCDHDGDYTELDYEAFQRYCGQVELESFD